MNAATLQDPAVPFVSAQPNDFDRRRIERALTHRKRYRYVSPSVHTVSNGYLIRSPCCSRNVDPEGGVIDVALMIWIHQPKPWCLYRKDHEAQEWRLHTVGTRLVDLLEELNADTQRLFWQ
jgi:hypothetical protein